MVVPRRVPVVSCGCKQALPKALSVLVVKLPSVLELAQMVPVED
jgi:hypothetical protein